MLTLMVYALIIFVVIFIAGMIADYRAGDTLYYCQDCDDLFTTIHAHKISEV